MFRNKSIYVEGLGTLTIARLLSLTGHKKTIVVRYDNGITFFSPEYESEERVAELIAKADSDINEYDPAL